jgi:hypothetical protein
VNGEKKRFKRRYAYTLGRSSLVIDVTPDEYRQILDGKIAIEKVKSTPAYTVYRKKKYEAA